MLGSYFVLILADKERFPTHLIDCVVCLGMSAPLFSPRYDNDLPRTDGGVSSAMMVPTIRIGCLLASQRSELQCEQRTDKMSSSPLLLLFEKGEKSTKIIRPLSLPSWRLIIFHFEAARTHTDRRNAHLDGLLVLLLLRRRRRAATSPRMSLGPKNLCPSC